MRPNTMAGEVPARINLEFDHHARKTSRKINCPSNRGEHEVYIVKFAAVVKNDLRQQAVRESDKCECPKKLLKSIVKSCKLCSSRPVGGNCIFTLASTQNFRYGMVPPYHQCFPSLQPVMGTNGVALPSRIRRSLLG